IPKLTTSASESISRPKSEVVLVMRAIRPSSPSRKTAAPIACAAMVNCSGAPIAPALASIAPLKLRMIEMYPRKMLPAVKSVGSAYAALRGRRSGDFGSTKRSLRAMNLLPIDAPRDDCGTCHHPLSGPHRDLPFGPEQYIHSRAEPHQTDALAGRYRVARLLGKDNAACD